MSLFRLTVRMAISNQRFLFVRAFLSMASMMLYEILLVDSFSRDSSVLGSEMAYSHGQIETQYAFP